MFLVLKRLHSLWYLILSLSSLCLIVTIVFFNLNLYNHGDVTEIAYMAPLIASIITVIIFAYGLWGKANSYLMPTSSPRSNPCTRSVRHLGTSLLTLLWVTSTVSYGLINVLVERLLSGLTFLIAILIVIEAISSSRLGTEQRRILKEEERRVEFELRRLANNSGSTLAAATDFRKNKTHSNKSRNLELGSLDDDSSSGDNALAGVEIVRPKAIDPATVIYNQQILFESAQRHYHQQYQQYFFHQSRNDGSSGGSSGEGERREGRYDDIFLESSYKFEIPMNEPHYNSSTGGPSSSTHTTGPSPPSLSSLSSNEKLHLPSAPPAPSHSSHSHTHTYPSPPQAPQAPATPTTKEPQRTSLLKDDISQIRIQLINDTNPFRDQDYQAATELSASAPPYEPYSTESSSSPFVLPKFGEQRSIDNSSNSEGSSPFRDGGSSHSNYSNSNSNRMSTTPTATIATAITKSGVRNGQR